MEGFIYFMIYAGSALMIVNIVRYFRLIKNMRRIKSLAEVKIAMYIPFMLLVLFLIGYLVVGIFGKPDIVMAAILFGGSIFVFLMINPLMEVVIRIRDNELGLDVLYTRMKNNWDVLTNESLSVFRVNLTKDTVDERNGSDLYASDLVAQSYTDLMMSRLPSLVIREKSDMSPGLFSRAGLLRHFYDGNTTATEIEFCRRKSGQFCYVKMQAMLTMEPGGEDVIAFITEQDYNAEMVNDTILNKVLDRQYDIIAYLVGNEYGIVRGEYNKQRRGSVFPQNRYGLYEEYVKERIVPILHGFDEEKAEMAEAMSLNSITENLDKKEPYEVDLICQDESEIFHKHFTFYVVDKEARFYLLLKSEE